MKLLLAFALALPLCAQVFDDFNRSDGSPGSNWTTASGTWAIVSNRLVQTQGLDNGYPGGWVILHNSGTYEDVAVQAKLWKPSIDQRTVGLVIRYQNSGGNLSYYLGWVRRVNSAPDEWRILRYSGSITGGSFSVLATATTPFTDGGTVRFRASGSSLILEYWTGTTWVTRTNVTDATLTTGNIGLRANEQQAQYDDFYATPTPSTSSLTANRVVKTDSQGALASVSGTTNWCVLVDGTASPCAAGGGEINTGSNVGTAGTGFFDGKVGVDLQFRKANSTSNLMTIAVDSPNQKVDFTLNQGNFALSSIGGSLGFSQIAAGALSGSGNRLATIDNGTADGCATLVSGKITSTGIACGAGGGGEVNTASNQGTGGVGVFHSKVGVDLQFRNVNAGSSKITVTNDSGNKEIDIDIAEAQLSLANIGGSLAFSQIASAAISGNGNRLLSVDSGVADGCASFVSGKATSTGVACGTGGGGITSLNSLTVSAQTFAIGTSGTAPAFNSASGTHTLNIPMASASSVTAGLLSKTDYDTFTAKVAATRAVNTSSPLGGGGALSADLTLTCTTCVVTSGSYADPAWITSLAASKLTGVLAKDKGGTGVDLSATGGTSQVLKQTSAGGAVSVARLACSDLSDAGSGCSGSSGSGSAIGPVTNSGTSPLTITHSFGAAFVVPVCFDAASGLVHEIDPADITLNTNSTVITWGDGSTLTCGVIGGSSAMPLTTKGDLFGFGTSVMRVPVGSNGTFLTADSTQTSGLAWASSLTAVFLKLSGTTEGTCDASTAGSIKRVAGGAGVADTVRVCVKNAADAYVWVALF